MLTKTLVILESSPDIPQAQSFVRIKLGLSYQFQPLYKFLNKHRVGYAGIRINNTVDLTHFQVVAFDHKPRDGHICFWSLPMIVSHLGLSGIEHRSTFIGKGWKAWISHDDKHILSGFLKSKPIKDDDYLEEADYLRGLKFQSCHSTSLIFLLCKFGFYNKKSGGLSLPAHRDACADLVGVQMNNHRNGMATTSHISAER